jgi:arginase
VSLIIYAGNAGDRNERAMRGAVSLGGRIAADFGVEASVVGSAGPVIEGGWYAQLQAASANLGLLSAAVAEQLKADNRLALVMGRCAASIATLPLIARTYPDAAIVWFDAHGDSNIPMREPASDMSYLGGMVITGAAGEWSTGFGDDLDLANVVLVGARDLDPPEQRRVDLGQIKLVPVGPKLSDRLRTAINGRRVYVHLDCDVLDAGLLATEYQSPQGLSLHDLRVAFEVLAEHAPCGLEITEYEGWWPDGRASPPDKLLSAIRPLLQQLLA